MLKAISFIPVLAATAVSASPALSGEISGRQYVVLRRGAYPIPDNIIHIIPCTSKEEILSVPLDCKLIETESGFDLKVLRAGSALLEVERVTLLSKYGMANPGEEVDTYEICRRYTGIDREIVPLLAKKPGYRTTRTDYEGKFSFNCPTK